MTQKVYEWAEQIVAQVRMHIHVERWRSSFEHYPAVKRVARLQVELPRCGVVYVGGRA